MNPRKYDSEALSLTNRYYECEILTDGPIKIGWMLAAASPDADLGNDEMSWAYDGHYEEKVHSAVCDSYGKRWLVGDVIGVFLDIQDRTISEFQPCFLFLITFRLGHFCFLRQIS